MSTDTAEKVAAGYALTRERLEGTQPYEEMKAAAAKEEAEGSPTYFHRNRLAYYIEVHTPFP